VQLTSDGHKAYLAAIEQAFGADVDYAQLVKLYGPHENSAERRCSPGKCIGIRRDSVIGSPDPAHISTSYAELANLTMRMHMRRRLTRLDQCILKENRKLRVRNRITCHVLQFRPRA
jgi:hypothetical protein